MCPFEKYEKIFDYGIELMPAFVLRIKKDDETRDKKVKEIR